MSSIVSKEVRGKGKGSILTQSRNTRRSRRGKRERERESRVGEEKTYPDDPISIVVPSNMLENKEKCRESCAFLRKKKFLGAN